MPTLRRLFPLIAALVIVALAGCGGGKSSSNAASNGLAAKSPQEILTAASAALGKVHSFHMSGTEKDAKGPLSLSGDVSLPGKAKLTLRQGAGIVDFVVIGTEAYIKANNAFWQAQKGTGAVATLLADKWVKVPAASTPGFGEFTSITDPAKIGHCLLQSHLGTVTKAGSGSVAGQSTVVLEDKGDAPGSSPGKVYIASSGPPLPLRAVQTGAKKAGGTPDAMCGDTGTSSTTITSDLTLSNYGKPVAITAPAGALDLSKLGGGTTKQ
jgi:hypothetical protein